MNKKILILTAFLLTRQISLFAQEEILSLRIDTPVENMFQQLYDVAKMDVMQSIDKYGNLYMRAWSSLSPVSTFINTDGTVTVCASDEKAQITYIFELSPDLEEIKTLNFKNELDMLGAFSKDEEGNYYFFYARVARNTSSENMAVVMYNNEGEKINIFKHTANPRDGFSSIKKPFDAGTCRLEISASLIAVFFAHKRFDGHQASFGFVLDRDTFKRVDRGHAYYYRDGTYPKGSNLMPCSGHSFNQFILPIENGFVFVDHGDAYPRAFTFGRFLYGAQTVRLNAFKFPGPTGENATYAQMGGLVKTSEGYIFAGAYGRISNNPRNIFIITFDENLTKCSEPLYLTRYTKNEGHAAYPKIVSIGGGKYLLLWERFSFTTQDANILYSMYSDYLSTYALVINEKGEAVSEIKEFKNIRLNMNDVLRYNAHNGKVYWAVNDSSSITVYGLEI